MAGFECQSDDVVAATPTSLTVACFPYACFQSYGFESCYFVPLVRNPPASRLMDLVDAWNLSGDGLEDPDQMSLLVAAHLYHFYFNGNFRGLVLGLKNLPAI